MQTQTQFTIKLSEEESKIIKTAADLSGLGHSSFARMCALDKAREILIKNGIKF